MDIKSLTRPCKLCGKPIVDAVRIEANGKEVKLVLDPRPATYTVDDPPRRTAQGTVVATRAAQAWVNHFATCPHANYFNRGRKKPGAEGEPQR
jgi:hypothetical protein